MSLTPKRAYVNPATVKAITPDHVPIPGGVPVTVHGSGFLAGAVVVIAGRLAPLTTVVDDATLTVVVPE